MDTHTHTDNILKQASTHLKHESPPIPEQQLKQAIMKGIERGNKQKRINRRLLKWGLPTGAVAICALLFIMVTLQPNEMRVIDNTLDTANAAQYTNIPTHVVRLLDGRTSHAAQHGLYQPINKTTENDEIKLTIDGIIADENNATIYYTTKLKSPSAWDKTILFHLFNDKGESLSDMMAPIEQLQINNTNAYHAKFTLNYETGRLPSRLTIKGTPITHSVETSVPLTQEENDIIFKPGNEFAITIPIDTSKFEGLAQEIKLNRHVKTAQYEFTIEKAILNPMSTELQIKMEQPNEKIFSKFIEPNLIISDPKYYNLTRKINTINSSIPITNEKTGTISIFFDSIYYKEHYNISFQASGIEKNFEKQPKLVIDTDKQQLLSSPDEYITLEKVTRNKENNITGINLNIKKKPYNDHPMVSVSNITDSNGKKYTFKSTRYWNTVSKEVNLAGTVIIAVHTQDFAQPLTLDLQYYLQSDKFDVPLNTPLVTNHK